MSQQAGGSSPQFGSGQQAPAGSFAGEVGPEVWNAEAASAAAAANKKKPSPKVRKVMMTSFRPRRRCLWRKDAGQGLDIASLGIEGFGRVWTTDNTSLIRLGSGVVKGSVPTTSRLGSRWNWCRSIDQRCSSTPGG